ncbi:MAG: M2 family metallopeptidase [Acidobacteria bacterium]|nr:M2 family metallopeptidase [Acidobacteriota bacterium]
MNFRFLVLGALLLMVRLTSTTPVTSAELSHEPDAVKEAGRIIADYEARIGPLEKAVGMAWWNANVTGRDEDFKQKEDAQNKLDAELANPDRYARLKRVRETMQADLKKRDPMLARQVEVLYLIHLEKQVDTELLKSMSAKGNAIEQAFNVYRPRVDGKELTDSEVRKLLKESKDSARRRAVWEASKGVGPVVEKELKELVKIRNEAARKLGFRDYHVMMLALNEQKQEDVIKLFDQLDDLTRTPFAKVKAEMDDALAKSYGIKVDELRPWHYHDPFFQEPPAVFATSIDEVYAKADLLKLCEDFYRGIGLPIDDVIARSDLYEKQGKSPHAFCIDIDRAGDVRVLANIVPNEYWMGTMLHELGHSVYSSRNIPRTMPYVLRTDAHILATEGVAMMFERWSKNGAWLEKMGVKVEDPKAFTDTGSRMRRNFLLILSRWCQVMLRFEQGMYANPDQDLNKLWWDLVEKYQMIKRPEGRNAPDYASKIHIISAPCYYHNYMMGQLFACQLHAAIARDALKGADPASCLYIGNKDVGRFMKDKVFGLGRSLSWKDLTRYATGEELNAKAFANEFSVK